MFQRINQCDVYVGLWCIYMLQEVLYAPGIINQFIQLIMLIWGMIIMFKYIIQSENIPSILKATLLLIVMYIIYGVVHIMFDDPVIVHPQYHYIQVALNSLVPIFVFYYFTYNGDLTGDRIRIYLPFLIVTCILLYYRNESSVMIKLDQGEITNNMGYYFVALIPLVFFYFNIPVLQYIYISVILIFIIMGMKRGAIFIGFISLSMLLYHNIKDSSRSIKLVFFILSVAFLLGIISFLDYMVNKSEYFMLRVQDTLDGNSSGRDFIYSKLLEITLLEPRPLYFYLGRGAESTLKIVGNGAHQDWLETFCNNGLIGVIILFRFFYIFCKSVLTSRLYFPKMMFYSFLVIFIIIFCKTLFSMSIQNLLLPESMLIGYFSSELDDRLQNNISA